MAPVDTSIPIEIRDTLNWLQDPAVTAGLKQDIRSFNRIDLNHDGFIGPEELRQIEPATLWTSLQKDFAKLSIRHELQSKNVNWRQSDDLCAVVQHQLSSYVYSVGVEQLLAAATCRDELMEDVGHQVVGHLWMSNPDLLFDPSLVGKMALLFPGFMVSLQGLIAEYGIQYTAAVPFAPSARAISVALSHPTIQTRMTIIADVQELPLAARREMLEIGLNNDSPLVRNAALELIQYLPASERRGLLEMGLKNEAAFLRMAAIKQLPTLPVNERLAVLNAGLSDGNQHVREISLEQVQYLPLGDRNAILMTALHGFDSSEHAVAMAQVEHLPVGERKAIIEIGLDDREADVGVIAAGQIRHLPLEERRAMIELGMSCCHSTDVVVASLKQIHVLPLAERLPLIKKGLIAPPGIHIPAGEQIAALQQITALPLSERLSVLKIAWKQEKQDWPGKTRWHELEEIQVEKGVRGAVVYQAGQLAADDCVELIEMVLDEGDENQSVSAFMQVAHLPPNERRRMAKMGLKHKNDTIRITSLKLLQGFSPEDRLDAIRIGLKDKSEYARAFSMEQADVLPSDERLAAIRVGIKDKADFTRKMAMKWTSNLPQSEYLAAVRAGLRDTYYDIRVDSVLRIANLPQSEYLAAVRAAMNDTENQVRLAALTEVSLLLPAERQSIMDTAWKKDEWMREAALQQVQHLPSNERWAWVERGMKEQEKFTRLIAVGQAQYLSQDELKTLIKLGYHDREWEVSDYALAMVKHLPIEERWPFLVAAEIDHYSRTKCITFLPPDKQRELALWAAANRHSFYLDGDGLEFLEYLRPGERIQVVERALRDKNEGIRNAASVSASALYVEIQKAAPKLPPLQRQFDQNR